MNNKTETTLLSSVICMIGFAIGYISCMIDRRPTAMEVYQGKTTLEITYRNGVPIDSMVVYKE